MGRFVSLCADLAEAEGRLLREHGIRVAALLGVLVAGLVIAVVGLGLLLLALYMALEDVMPDAAAVAICGVLCLAAAGGAAMVARSLR